MARPAGTLHDAVPRRRRGALGRDENSFSWVADISPGCVRAAFRPQLSRFWGWRSWLRALGYEAFSWLTRCPIGTQDGSVGSHLCERFPEGAVHLDALRQGTLMMPAGPRTVRLRSDTVESLLAQEGIDSFCLSDVDPQAKAILRTRTADILGYYASADLTAQADAIYFVRRYTPNEGRRERQFHEHRQGRRV
jgi:hypothetical protein